MVLHALAVVLAAASLATCAANDRPAPSRANHDDRLAEHPAPHDASHAPTAHPHRFDDAEHWARVFDDPARDAWQKPDQIIAALRIPENAKIADIGAGTGYFAVRIGRAYPNATVYAVDIEPNLIEHMRARAEREKLPNVRPVLAAPDDARLVERVDLVLIVDTYHHIDGRPAYFRRLSRMLRHDAELAVIDYRKDSPFGPPPRHRIAEEVVIAEMREAGFEVARRHDFLPHQYFLVFTRRP